MTFVHSCSNYGMSILFICMLFVSNSMAFFMLFVANRCINCGIYVLFILYDICG